MLCDELRIALSSSINAPLDDIDLAFGTGWNVVRGNGSWMHQPGRLVGKPVRWHADSLRTALDYLVPLYNLRATGRSSVQERVEGSLTRFSGQFTCRHHAASAAAAGLLSYSTGLRSPIEV